MEYIWNISGIYPYHILTMLFLTLQSLDLWLTLAVKAKRCFDRCELFQLIRLAFFFPVKFPDLQRRKVIATPFPKRL